MVSVTIGVRPLDDPDLIGRYIGASFNEPLTDYRGTQRIGTYNGSINYQEYFRYTNTGVLFDYPAGRYTVQLAISTRTAEPEDLHDVQISVNETVISDFMDVGGSEPNIAVFTFDLAEDGVVTPVESIIPSLPQDGLLIELINRFRDFIDRIFGEDDIQNFDIGGRRF